jgi:hypothetical protein
VLSIRASTSGSGSLAPAGVSSPSVGFAEPAGRAPTCVRAGPSEVRSRDRLLVVRTLLPLPDRRAIRARGLVEDALEEQGLYDPLMQKMVAAFTGDTATWAAVNQRLRDAMVEFAATRSPYYRRVLGDAGGRFDRVPVLTKALIRRHQDELFAEGVPEWRRIRRATSGSTGEPMVFFRDLSQGPIENQSARRFLLWLHGISLDARMVWIAANLGSVRTSRDGPGGGADCSDRLGRMSSTASPRWGSLLASCGGRSGHGHGIRGIGSTATPASSIGSPTTSRPKGWWSAGPPTPSSPRAIS